MNDKVAAYQKLINKLIGKLEHQIDNPERLEKLQAELDRIAKLYQRDDDLGVARYKLYQAQAMISYRIGNLKKSYRFLQQSIDVRGESYEGAEQLAQYLKNEMKQHEDRQPLKHKKVIVLAIIILLFAIATLVAGPISDYFTIKDANPTMVQLAKDAGMSRKGELLFIRTHPQLDSDSQFTNDCPTTAANGNGSSLLGCYDPPTNRIYILQMPSTLYNVEVTTAAYEMLHPVYASIDSSDLNSAIEGAYNSITGDSSSCTDDIPGQVALFAKTEPGARDDELFSLLGTECNDLPSDLASYYQSYFTNLSVDIADNQQVDSIFTNDQTQFNTLQSTINQDDSDANTAYADSVSWANDGNQYEDTYNYNIYTQDFNDENAAINQYNSLVQQYNTLIVAFTGGQPVNQVNNVQVQGSQ
jgi:hypothetical protein